jgi:ubiquinone/menaquinone biosynthesis C-methylase UbiE
VSGPASRIGTPADAKTRAHATYNAAADFYDDPANTFWERFGRATVERLGLAPGARVLDVCCGSGASALPAAETVGPEGQVHAVDLCDNLLALGREKARARRLANVEFHCGDILALEFPDESFDAVICVFGIFFVPDMPAAARELWRRVRPGGRLAITTWGPRLFEPANGAFWDSVRAVRPELYKGFNPWDLVCDPPALRAVLERGGVEGAEVVAVSATHPVPAPEAWWALVMGSGYRGTVDRLAAADRERVRAANLAFIRDSGTRAVETNVVYAVAVKP